MVADHSLLCVLCVSSTMGLMTGALAQDEADRLRTALEELLSSSGEDSSQSSSTRQAFLRLVDVLEMSPDAVVFAADTLVSTQEAADVLGVSRMTVVRLIDRGELAIEGSGGVHRRIPASELARYVQERTTTRRSALDALGSDIGDDTPVDQVIVTR